MRSDPLKTINFSLLLPLHSLRKNFELIKDLSWREIEGRYRGSLGGLLWALLQPIFMLSVYTTVFGYFLKFRWGGAETTTEFALVLYAGLLIFNFFAECFNRAPTLILNSPNLVKKVVFPLEIFPIVAMFSAIFHYVIGFCVWLFFYIYLYGAPHWTLALLPLVLFPLIPLVLGMGWLLSACGVYLRDISQITALLTQALLFLSPVFFSTESMPPDLRTLMFLNPLTFIIEQVRAVSLYNTTPNWLGLLTYSAISLIFAYGGLWFFQKLRSDFSSAI